MIKTKILLAEDDKFISKAYNDGLKRAGFEIQTASDGLQAMEVLDTFTPDIILLDIIMPEMNGFEVLKKVKESPKWKTIPVLVLSNLGQQSDIKKALSLGAANYLIKSDFSLEEIVKKITNTLKK